MGTRVERTRVAVADRDWRSVGRTEQAVRALAGPAAPHSRTDKPRGPDSERRRMGQAEWRVYLHR